MAYRGKWDEVAMLLQSSNLDLSDLFKRACASGQYDIVKKLVNDNRVGNIDAEWLENIVSTREGIDKILVKNKKLKRQLREIHDRQLHDEQERQTGKQQKRMRK